MKKHFLLSLISILFSLSIIAQSTIDRIEPPNWWADMNNPEVQLLLHGKDIGDLNPKIDYEGVSIRQVIKVENPNYLFVDLNISKAAKSGNIVIQFQEKGKTILTENWELQAREKVEADRTTFDQSDVLYLITPDRFANGDPANDAVAGMREKPDRSNKGGRHGGDIEGIRQHLDYVADLGFTAIWVNPVLENDMAVYSYHGYSTTDFYKVDPRFGTNEAYKSLVKEAESKGIKFIMDMIVNHCGSYHWWMEDLPCSDWINQWPEYTNTNHRKATVQDPYSSKIDKKLFTDGWFVPTMPDLNQRNPLMANYLTQNAIWWIEYLGLAGIRMDTYPYPDMEYMTEWTRRVEEEYPNYNVVGEEWNINPTIVAYWQRGKTNANGYTSYLRSLMDFPLQSAMVKALNSDESWGKGLMNLYELLAQDFVYAAPEELVVFPDNHDMSRIFTQLNEDYDKLKNAIAYILTVRGVPQFYYGTEILMTNPGTGDHGIIRSDFPGGWEGDTINAFNNIGLTTQQMDAHAFFKKLLNWRKTATVVHHGKLMHYAPKDGVYVFFRYNENKKVMIVLNKNEQAYTLQLDRFSEILDGVSNAKEVISGKSFMMKNSIELPAKQPMILELK
ncbi:MAG: glycosidase [Saprospiraceae bacterium]|jgi:glycosidase